MQWYSKQWAVILLLLLFLSGGYNVFLQSKSKNARCQLNKEKLKLDSVLSLKIQTEYALKQLRDSVRDDKIDKGLVIIKKDPAPTSSMR